MRKIKWGVLGYARIAKNDFIPALLKSENSEFYAIASRDSDKLKECGELFNCPKLYSDYNQVIEDPDVEAVYIPLPNSMHKEWSIKAMAQGKHVLCEKPIGLSAAECREMMDASEKYGVILMEAFMYRYTDRVKQVRDILDSGEIGEVKYINSSFRFHLNRPNTIKIKPELGGGSLYDVGCYPVNFAGMVTNAMPESYSAQYVLEHGVDMIFSAVLKYPNGIIATLNCGFNAFRQIHSEIIGTKGRIDIPDTFLGDAGVLRVETESGTREVPVAESERYVLEATDFADAVLQKRKPLLSLEETYRNMQVLDQLLQLIKA